MMTDGCRGAEDGLGEMDDAPVTRREVIGVTVLLLIIFVAAILAEEKLIFIPGL